MLGAVEARREITLEEKLDFLSRPESFPDAPAAVECIETHFAWVYLSADHAYKLRKPIRFDGADFTRLADRERNCRIEVELNRRLAADTYLGPIPLALGEGGLALGGRGRPVDWLVEMRRLPASRMLPRLAADGAAAPEALERLVHKLVAFYAATARAPWTGRDYVARLERQIERYVAPLLDTRTGIERSLADATAGRQRRFLAGRAELLVERVEQGRVVDAHGDLKPEHICLLDDPQIIDCLEFDAELRLLDSAEEIAFLALECRRLGLDRLAADLPGRYRRIAVDPVPDALWRFYRSSRALVRAYLSASRLLEGGIGRREPWRQRAAWYLRRADEDIRRALADRRV